jgi:hypothetical protein
VTTGTAVGVANVVTRTTVCQIVARGAVGIATSVQAESVEQFRQLKPRGATDIVARIDNIARGAVINDIARAAIIRREQVSQTTTQVEPGQIAGDFVTGTANDIARIASGNSVTWVAVVSPDTID